MTVELIKDMSDKDYFAIDAVNASTLKAMVNPEKAHYRKLNPVHSDAFKLGSDFHALVLQGLEPADSEDVAISPFDAFRTNESKAWKAEQIKAGKTILKAAEVESYTADLKAMADAVYTLDDFVKEMDATQDSREVVILWERRVGDAMVKCKAKLDLFNLNGSYVYDLKTCGNLDTFDSDVFKYGYYIQAAWYLEAAMAAGSKAKGFRFAVAGKDKPCQAVLREMDATHINQGYDEICSLLEVYLNCKESGVWNSPYTTKPQMVSAPGWWLHKCGISSDIKLEY